MTNLKKLKAAYDAATPGEWEYNDGLIYGPPTDASEEAYLICDVSPGMIGVNEQDEHNINFITLAHNLMPQLLDAVSLMQEACEYASPLPPELVTKIERLLEKLK